MFGEARRRSYQSKLMVIDGEWNLTGSAYWDIRSLRLNFEVAVETYDPGWPREWRKSATLAAVSRSPWKASTPAGS
jgi:phosphatidylserine/phosphatidylglycerophosphate/cardiolipin synthase-like enzyme